MLHEGKERILLLIFMASAFQDPECAIQVGSVQLSRMAGRRLTAGQPVNQTAVKAFSRS